MFVARVVGESMNRRIPNGSWEHARVLLAPDTHAEGYEPIRIESADAPEMRVIAEWLGPVG